ncbi:cellulose binding domain-containing protein [Actinopolymorpha sp. B17G11]|uniref:cellulose binding domain-containing protein n=1 Tax=unclassified Actinopolymorpha TaxID=2627063 RepID=UPI0032D97148
MERRKVPTLSTQERTIVLVGVIAAAMATTFVLAAVFASSGSSTQARLDASAATPTVSTTRATPAADSARTPRTARARATSPSPTVSRRSTAAGVAPVRGRDRPTVTFRPASSWDDGFVGVVTITNTTAAPLTWELSFELHDAEIDDVWQATLDQSDSGVVVARGLDYNAVVAPGERVEFGFRAEGTDRPRVGDCTLNGQSCRIRRG